MNMYLLLFLIQSFEFIIMKTVQNISAGAGPHQAYGAQYRIYAYNKFCEGATGLGTNKWIMLQSHSDKELILREARRLQNSDKFEKIEVKEKAFDTKQQRHLIKTLYPSRSMNLMDGVKTISWIALAVTIGLSIAYLI